MLDRELGQMSAVPFGKASPSTVFFSYKSEDAALARFIAEQMAARGRSVWFDEYCIALTSWDSDFEAPLRAGIASAASAVFFTNSKWAISSWCTDIEAKPLLERLPKSACLEVRIPYEPGPHTAVPKLALVKSIEVRKSERWTILGEVCEAFGLNLEIRPRTRLEKRPLRGKINGVNYELNIQGWEVRGRGLNVLGGDFALPPLSRKEDGVALYANIVVGKRGWERKELNAIDNREVFQNLRLLASSYFERAPLTGKCVGVHLVWHDGMSHGAFTYWAKNSWGRKYEIVLPAKDGGADVTFVFTCAAYGDFATFSRHAWLFDDLVTSLKYGTEWD